MSTRTRCMLLFTAVLLSVFGGAVGPANAWHADGIVYCDANGDGVLSAGDAPLGNVGVSLQSQDCAYATSTVPVTSTMSRTGTKSAPITFPSRLQSACTPSPCSREPFPSWIGGS